MLNLPEVKKLFKYRGHLSRNLRISSTLSVEMSSFARKSVVFLMSVTAMFIIV
jgi:hypothetical protein